MYEYSKLAVQICHQTLYQEQSSTYLQCLEVVESAGKDEV